jgi:hypothetical protein
MVGLIPSLVLLAVWYTGQPADLPLDHPVGASDRR